MNLKKISNQELQVRIEKLVRTERKVMHLILHHIVEFEDRRLYAELGFDSMFAYLTRSLGYSESSAYRRLTSARLLRQVPEISEQIESGTLNLPIETKIIVKPQRDESVRMELTFTEEQYKTLVIAKDLISHICVSGEWTEILTALADRFNRGKLGADYQNTTATQSLIKMTKSAVKLDEESHIGGNSNNVAENFNRTDSKAKDSVAKQLATKHVIKNDSATKELVMNKSISAQNSRRMASRRKNARVKISIRKRRHLLAKSNHCCEFVSSSGVVCESKFQLQIDHRLPIALGGSNDLSNLRILCRTHNLHAAKIGFDTLMQNL